MSAVDQALDTLRELEDFAKRETLLHGLHPFLLFGLVTGYILVVLSFHNQDLAGLILMSCFLMVLYSLADLSIFRALYRVRYALFLVVLIGLFNPLLNQSPALRFGSMVISQGWISFVSLALKGLFCVLAVYLLSASVSFERLCQALGQMPLPGFIPLFLLMMWRSLYILLEEVQTMSAAYALRAPNQKGIHISAWGSFLGQLLLRSMDQARAIYESMQLRGYSADSISYEKEAIRPSGLILVLSILALILLFRLIPIGQLLTGWF